jgi:hypothetical protein
MLQKLEQELGADTLERARQRLGEFDLVIDLGDSVMSSAVKDQWSALAREAEGGKVTVIERRGVSLALIPVDKLMAMAATASKGRTMADILDSFPGVDSDFILRARSSGGPVRTLTVPTGDPLSAGGSPAARPSAKSTGKLRRAVAARSVKAKAG